MGVCATAYHREWCFDGACQFWAYLVYVVFMTTIIYPIVVAMTLAPVSFPRLWMVHIDFAGSGIVHLTVVLARLLVLLFRSLWPIRPECGPNYLRSAQSQPCGTYSNMILDNKKCDFEHESFFFLCVD